MVREKYPRIYIIVYKCCSKERFMNENKQRAKDEKREKIISKIEDV
jgi:hypothetical protein